MTRWIIHVDMDAFFAAVEQRDCPEYRGKPVIIGGLGNRGVVSTASYEARKYGVHSAMPMSQARRLCPEGIYLSNDHAKYARVARQIRSILDEFSPLVEPLSIDEAFLDVSGMDLLHQSPVDIAKAIKAKVKEELNLTVSAGVASNKFLAKLASDIQKPDGLVFIEAGQEAAFLKDLPVERLWGIGKVSAQALRKIGIECIGQIACMDSEMLQQCFGNAAGHYKKLACGVDEREVICDQTPKSIGAEETFETDIVALEDIYAVLMELAERVGRRLRRYNFAARTVTLKVRYPSFVTLTRQRTLDCPTQLDEELYLSARQLLSELNPPGAVRLLGLTASKLELPIAPQGSLFDTGPDRRVKITEALDRLRDRFGSSIIVHGRLSRPDNTKKIR